MAILVKDSFNRANSTTGLGQTETGQLWQTYGSVWGIENNAVYPVNASVLTFPYIVSPKIDNITFQIKIAVNHFDAIIVYKVVDATTGYIIESSGVYKMVSGVTTKLAGVPQFQNNDVIKVKIINNVHTIYINDIQVTTFSDSSVNGDKFGFSTYGNQSMRYDDFLIEDVSNGIAHTLPLLDSITTSDTISKRLSVMVADTIATSENGNENINKLISDFIPIGDNVSVSNSNTRTINLNDSIAILDSISKSLTRSIYDNLDLGDIEDKTVLKALVDSISLTDSFTKQSIQSIKLYDVIVTNEELDMFNPNTPELIGVINLKGRRELFVYLQGGRDLVVFMKGGLSMIPNQNFNMVSGDTKNLIIDIKEDLVGASVKWVLFKLNEPEMTLIKEGNVIDGEINITLDKGDTEELSGIYKHECEVTDQQGNVSTVTSGSVVIIKDMI